VRVVYIGASIIAFALADTSCALTNYYVRHVEIDSTLHIRPIGTRFALEPTHGSYYFFFHTERLISVDHFEKNPASGGRERSLYLETNPSLLLDRTVKQDVILRGPYGNINIYAEKTCFYNRPIESYSGVSVRCYLETLAFEVPRELAVPPESLPPLTSVGLVRIFRTDPEYVVVSANYEPDGKLGSLHIDKTKGGDWVSGVILLDLDVMQARAATYGIPGHIDIQQYLRSRRLPIFPSAFPEAVGLLNQFYGYDTIIRQDKLNHGVVVSSRFLQPSITQEEQILNPVCESRFR
jgi:hypothetical protein